MKEYTKKKEVSIRNCQVRRTQKEHIHSQKKVKMQFCAIKKKLAQKKETRREVRRHAV